MREVGQQVRQVTAHTLSTMLGNTNLAQTFHDYEDSDPLVSEKERLQYAQPTPRIATALMVAAVVAGNAAAIALTFADHVRFPPFEPNCTPFFSLGVCQARPCKSKTVHLYHTVSPMKSAQIETVLGSVAVFYTLDALHWASLLCSFAPLMSMVLFCGSPVLSLEVIAFIHDMTCQHRLFVHSVHVHFFCTLSRSVC
jgi:hypothetical protein